MSEETFVINGRLPGLNEYQLRCRNNRFDGARCKQEAQALCEYALIRLRRNKVHFEKVDVDITWIEKNKRRDKDNISFGRKFIFDALQSMKILDNDGWGQIGDITERFRVDKDNPRIEIRLRGVENGK